MEMPVVAVEESAFSLINRLLSLHTKVVAHKALALAPKAGQVLQQPTNTDVHLHNTVYLQHFICDPTL